MLVTPLLASQASLAASLIFLVQGPEVHLLGRHFRDRPADNHPMHWFGAPLTSDLRFAGRSVP
jgi:hypothetical protein